MPGMSSRPRGEAEPTLPAQAPESAARLRSALQAAAVATLGAERAAALGSDLDAFATDLARVASTPLADDVEPGASPVIGPAPIVDAP
jgi:hypothetical protein